eukprot:2362319-Pleurochrysis_carterae.AAC.2
MGALGPLRLTSSIEELFPYHTRDVKNAGAVGRSLSIIIRIGADADGDVSGAANNNATGPGKPTQGHAGPRRARPLLLSHVRAG